ncbi:hypothetical protein CPB84DRAFT_1688636 [Gymnopilus junonius]|uniref:Uncharacterized protein n=1 Tax=Gymnopilus junonius TaxID=109634 RepID=A0A9P5NBT8_GYMJU|nr:hypothetical protein CPB84DRAFT_1688636 [Gymnopilus junonius]
MDAIRAFFSLNGIAVDENWTTQVKKWACLQLPNGQFIRTAWKEKQKFPSKVRMSRNVNHDGDSQSLEFAEVQFFFKITLRDRVETMALVSKFGAPDVQLCAKSSGALLICQYQGVMALEVISIKAISSCMAMVPFPE